MDDFILVGNVLNLLVFLSDEWSFGLKFVKVGVKGFFGFDLDVSYDFVLSVEYGYLGFVFGMLIFVVLRCLGGWGFELELVVNVFGFSL